MHRAVAELAAGQIGLVTRPQLREYHSTDAIDRSVSVGRLEVIHPGIYRIAGAHVTIEQRLLAAQLATGGSSAVSFEAAAMLFEIDRIRTNTPQITVVHAQIAELHGVIVRRTRLWAPGDLIMKGPLRVTSPYRTIIDLAGVLSADRLEDALDDAIRRRLVSVSGMVKRLEIRGRRGVKGAGRLAALLDARIGSRPKASSLQNAFRRGLVRAGLPTPEEEYEVFDASGRFVARVDFAYPDLKIYIEVDGSHHETKKQRDSDRVRQNRLSAAGWTPLRYDKDQVRTKTYVAEIGAVLRSG